MLGMKDFSSRLTKKFVNSRLLFIVIILAFSAVLTSTAKSMIYAETEPGKAERLVAGLNGEQVIPPVKTNATGEVFFLPKSGSLTFMLNLTGISKVAGAEIQMANTSKNGPSVVNLSSPSNILNETTNGILMKGNFTSSSIIGPMAGKPITDLEESMKKGNTYLIITTAKYPKGEIRGQIGSEGIDESGTSIGQNNVTESADLLNEPE